MSQIESFDKLSSSFEMEKWEWEGMGFRKTNTEISLKKAFHNYISEKAPLRFTLFMIS